MKSSVETRQKGNLIKFPAMDLQRFAARETIFSECEAASDVFEILQGAVMVLRNLPGGRRQILDIAGPGRFIGLTAGAAHDCSAIALRDVALYSTPAARRGRALHGVDLTAAMSGEIHRLRDLATALGRKTAAERMAGFVLAMAGGDDASLDEVVLPVSRLEIADHLGLALETVCRNLTLLKRKGFIRLEGNFGVTVLDPAALRQIASGVPPQGGLRDKKAVNSRSGLI